MSLNKSQQSQWTVIVGVFSTISRLSQDPAIVHKEMESWITAFEKDCNDQIKVIIKLGDSPSIFYLDSSKDSLKLVRDNAPSTVLRAKVFGVSLSSTIQYKESYQHNNDMLVNALRTLADKIEGLPLELSEQTESMDVLEYLGGKASVPDEEGERADIDPSGEQADEAAVVITELLPAEREPSSEVDEDEAKEGRLIIQLVPEEI